MKTDDALAVPVGTIEKPSALICTKCGHTKSAEFFYSKGQGRIDSRCKACVSKLKKVAYRKITQAEAKSKSNSALFSCRVIGQPGRDTIEDFASVITESVQGLIDEGKI